MGGTTEVAKMVGDEFSKLGYSVDFIILDKKSPGLSSLEKLSLPIIRKYKKITQSWTSYSKEVGYLFSKYDGLILNGSFARVAHAALEFTRPETAVIDIQHIAVNPVEPAVIAQNEWDAIVGVSSMIGVQLKNYYSKDKKVEVIYNGVEVPIFLPQQDKNAEVFRIAYVGRVRERAKRVSRLVELADELVSIGVNFELMIIGDGESRGELEKLFQQSAANQRVRFYGKLEHKEVYEVLTTCHASVLVSDFESFGLVLPEAQMCGAVPISSRMSGVTDVIIEDGVTGFLCDIGDMKGMAKCLATISENRELWQELSKKGRNKALEMFTSVAMGRKYEALLNEIWQEKIRSSRFENHPFLSYRLEILAWPADGAKRIGRKIRFSLEEIFGRFCELF